MLSVFLAVKMLVWGQHVLFQTDSTMMTYYLNKLGETRFNNLNQLSQEMVFWGTDYWSCLTAVHFMCADNVQADDLSGPRNVNSWSSVLLQSFNESMSGLSTWT